MRLSLVSATAELYSLTTHLPSPLPLPTCMNPLSLSLSLSLSL
ncbi:unnamed protein product [Spirodela intermedia]|uniref:Uncharacterized protein n=1 Tax=Spirodela intermedia TaxID=51605 RepID=A0A7I8K440_SPIIN|nr:unnamed protein product [Spirodela intermedia]